MPAPRPLAQPTSQPARAGSAETTAARAAIAQAVTAILARLSDSDYQTRQAAQADLTALGQAVLDELLAQANTDDPEQRQRSAQVLEQLSQAVSQTQMLLSLPAPQREAFANAAKSQPALFAKLASRDDGDVVEALGKLVADGKPGVETVLVWAINHPSAGPPRGPDPMPVLRR